MDRQRSQQFMQKMVGDVATALAVSVLFVAERSGLLAAMAGAGPRSGAELAARTGMPVRSVEECLAALAVSGYVEHDPATDRFSLPEEHAAFLVDPSSEFYLGGLVEGQLITAAATPRLAQAYAHGAGLPFTAFGPELPGVLERMNRSVYEHRLVRNWLPALPEVVARLQDGGRAVDVGCGTGIVPITLAASFPTARVAGLDVDAGSITVAGQNAAAAGVAVEFIEATVDALPLDPPWDLVTTFDVVHDLPDPLGALRRIRAALADGGTYLMVEPRVADRLEDNVDDPFARMLYGLSSLLCVPQSVAQGGPGFGACWGESRARELAGQAGFARFERLEVRSPVMAFYALSTT